MIVRSGNACGDIFDKRDTYGVLGTFVLWLLSHSTIVESAKPRRSLWFLSDTVSSRSGDYQQGVAFFAGCIK